MTTIQVLHYAALAAGYALALARLTDTARPLWNFLPAKLQPLMPALLVVLPGLADGLMHGASAQDVVNAIVAAAGALFISLRGAVPAAHFEQLSPSAKNEIAAVRSGKGGSLPPPSASALALLFAICLGASQSACTAQQVAAVESAVQTVVNDAIQSGVLVDLVQSLADQAFAKVPDAPLQDKVNALIAKARIAVADVIAATEKGQAAEPAIKSAIAQFKDAWNALQPLLKEAGIVNNGRFSRSGDALAEPLLLKVAQ